jgi:hypothetical protein
MAAPDAPPRARYVRFFSELGMDDVATVGACARAALAASANAAR